MRRRRRKRKKCKHNEIQNGIFIDKNVAYILGSKPSVKRKQAELDKEVQASEEGERASGGVFGSPEQSAERDPSASSSLGMSKLKFKPR